MNHNALKFIANFVLLAPASGLFSSVAAHVSLQEPVAEPGTAYRAVLRVSHGCDGSPTTAVTVQLPSGLADAKAEPKAGWTVSTQGNEVRWTAGKEAALPSKERGEFAINAKLPASPATLWLKVQQACEKGGLDWHPPVSCTAIELRMSVATDTGAPVSGVMVRGMSIGFNGSPRPSPPKPPGTIHVPTPLTQLSRRVLLDEHVGAEARLYIRRK